MHDYTGYPLNYFFNFHWTMLLRKNYLNILFKGLICKIFNIVIVIGEPEDGYCCSIGAILPLEEIEQKGFQGKHFFWIFGKKIHIYEPKELLK